jgi:hypothetical protein
MCVLLLAWGGWELLVAWRTGQAEDWRDFWENARSAPLFFPLLIFLAFPSIWRLTFEAMRRAIETRQAAVSGDDARAPLAKSQPEPDMSFSFTPGSSLGPLRWPRGLRINSWLFTLLFSVLFGLLTVVLGGLLVGTAQGDEGQTVAGFIVLAVAALLLLLSALAIWRLIALTRLFSVTADDSGLQWREPGRRKRKSIPWHEARAFILLRHHVGTEYARESAFALVGREATLAWLVKPTEVYGAHEQLAGLIVARTTLPLRDITGDVESAESAQDPDPMTALEAKVSTERKRAELAAHLALSQSPHEPQTVAEPSAAPTSTSGAPASAASARAGCLIALAALLLPWAPQGIGWGMQQYQQGHYASLPGQVHAQQPVFVDRLAYDDGRWPVTEDNDLHQSLLYQEGAYHLRGVVPTQTIAAPGPESYGDVAVEVTAAQERYGQQSDLYDGVGLLLRASERNTDFVAFLVTPSGEWGLWRFHDVGDETRNWNEIAGGFSRAIHPGAGEQNRLLVIASGARYLCYVNDQFVGVFQDDSPALAQGRMGVFVNESTTEGVFTDFAAYPAPVTDPLPFT